MMGAMAVGGMIGGYTSFASAQTTSDSTVAPSANEIGHPASKRFGRRFGVGKGAEAMGRRGVMGKVTAVSGNTITVTGPNGTSYTVDASSATVSKIVTIPVGQITVGDTVGVQGTLSGTNVTATHVMDGIPNFPKLNK